MDFQASNRSTQLYFPDGDVILSASTGSAGGVQQIQLFRVHKFLLSHHSAVFRDMFSLPPSDANETVDGVPVVALQDNVEPLERVLNVLYNPAWVGLGL